MKYDQYTSSAYEASAAIKVTGKGKLYWLSGYSSKAGNQFIQVHDSASLPADTAVPLLVMPAAGVWSFSLPVDGFEFENGIYVTNSSTAPTKTIGSADCWFQVQFK